MQRAQNRRSGIEAARMNKMTVQSMEKADSAARGVDAQACLIAL